MREIKFRGKRLDNGEWVYGLIIEQKGSTFIFNRSNCDSCEYHHKYCNDNPEYPESIACRYLFHPVIPETVGQYTECYDKHKKEVCDGDILRWSYINPMTKTQVDRIWKVEYSNGMYWLRDLKGKGDSTLYLRQEFEAIGTIHDLEVGDE